MSLFNWFKGKSKNIKDDIHVEKMSIRDKSETDEEFIERLRNEMMISCSICGNKKIKFVFQHLPIEVATGLRSLTQQEREGYAAICSSCGAAVCGICLPRLLKEEGKRLCKNCGEKSFPVRLKGLPHKGKPDSNKNDVSALIGASSAGDEETIHMFLNNGANVNMEDHDGMTPLIAAAANSHVNAVRLLLDRGADINATTNNGWTALMLASDAGDTNIVELLLERGANVKMREGAIGFVKAMLNGHQEIARTLLDSGVDPNSVVDDMPILIPAITKGTNDIVERLLDNGADVNAQDINGVTALMAAAAIGNESLVRMLLENGADVNIEGREDITALSLAKKNGHLDIVRLLTNS